jgi:hypothetical protein
MDIENTTNIHLSFEHIYNLAWNAVIVHLRPVTNKYVGKQLRHDIGSEGFSRAYPIQENYRKAVIHILRHMARSSPQKCNQHKRSRIIPSLTQKPPIFAQPS